MAEKADRYYELLQSLVQLGVPLDGAGLQMVRARQRLDPRSRWLDRA